MIYYTLGELIAVNLSNEYVYRYVLNPNDIEALMMAIDSNELKLTHMQYTGKVNMNGVDIYEEDIIYKEILSRDDPACGCYGTIGIIREDPRSMGWMINVIDENDRTPYHWMGISFNFSEIKVIGNVCQNSDLIT